MQVTNREAAIQAAMASLYGCHGNPLERKNVEAAISAFQSALGSEPVLEQARYKMDNGEWSNWITDWHGHPWAYDQVPGEKERRALYAVPPSPTEEIERLKAERDELRDYAHEVTKALTGLAGGGSEMFSREIGGIFAADIEKCCQTVRDRHAKAHDLLLAATKRAQATEAKLAAHRGAVTVKPAAELVPTNRLDQLIGSGDPSSDEIHDMAVELLIRRRSALKSEEVKP